MREIPRPGVAEPSGAPKVLGKYRCDDRLAGDGWLEVHRGRVQGLAGFDRVFAIVSLAPGALTRRAQAAENLLRAARQAATVQDPRLAAITDSGLAPGSAFVVTELVHGVSLRSLMAYLHGNGTTPPVPVSPNLDLVLAMIGAEIAGALAAAHDRSPPIAHGALAPAAVMVTPQGGVKLLNLGLTASVLTPAELTVSPARGPFAAPELSRGGTMGPQADMFALGALLAAVATGQRGQGSDRGRALNATLPTLAPMLTALTTAIPAGRPTAAEAEAGFRELFTRSRGVDVRAELGALVRATLQAGPEGPSLDAPEQMLAQDDAPSEMFNDEPTAILNMGGDSKANPMASLLRDMQGYDQAVEDSTAKTRVPLTFRGEPRMPQAHSAPTPEHVPAFPQPMSTGFENEPQTVMTSATSLPLPMAKPTKEVIVPAGPMRDTSPVAMPAANGAPTDELRDVTTEEISASLQSPLQPVEEDRARKAPAMTPSGWQPSGDLEGSDAGERPGSLGGIEIRSRRRSSRTLALAIASGALCVGAITGVVVLRSQRAGTPATAAASLTAPAAPSSAPANAPADSPSRPVIEPLVKAPVAPVLAAATTPTPAPVPEKSAAGPARSHPAAGRNSPVSNRPGGTAAVTPPAAATTAAILAEPAAPPASPPVAGLTGAPPASAHAAGEPAANSPAAPAAGPPAEIEIRTVPPGATAWLAGKARGTTPVTLAVPPDARELRLVRPGFQSKVIPLDGSTPRLVEQELVSSRAPLWGEAQLNVECKEKVKMPVLIDGEEIGLLCPTGFIGLSPGSHEVGVLDPATGQRHVQTVTLGKGQKRLRIGTSSSR
jgi:hypothetical protein